MCANNPWQWYPDSIRMSMASERNEFDFAIPTSPEIFSEPSSLNIIAADDGLVPEGTEPLQFQNSNYGLRYHAICHLADGMITILLILIFAIERFRTCAKNRNLKDTDPYARF